MTLAQALQAGNEVDILCIGTPHIVGDSIGPLIGAMLECFLYGAGDRVKIIGSIEDPVTYTNYIDKISEIRPGALVLVIDAIVGEPVGGYEISNEPLGPGAGVGHEIEEIGDWCIRCYTASTPSGLLTCSIHSVLTMASEITTRLMDLLEITKNKGYIEINIKSNQKALKKESN